MKLKKYDYLILGGGGAGLVGAKLARGLGKRVCIIEKKNLGGECTWTGCVPSKALIHVANTLSEFQKLNKHTITQSAHVPINGAQVMNYVRSCVDNIYSTHTPEKLSEQGIDVVFGDPRFINQQEVLCVGETFYAKKILLATGSSPFVPPIKGLESIEYLTNETVFALETLPDSIVIIGGGPIGVELGCALASLGTKVTIIEMQGRLLKHDDEELVGLLTEQLKEKGITLYLQSQVTEVEKKSDAIFVSFTKNEKTETCSAQHVLVAVGRKPNIEGLELEKAGVNSGRTGVIVNKYMRTSASTIYAAGDVAGPYLFSHIAERQSVVATKNALLPIKQKISYDAIGWVTFAGPELAAAGMTEREAREKLGDALRVYKIPYGDIDRPVVDDARAGLAKFMCDKKGMILGVHILGHRAGELLHEIQVARTFGLSLSKLDSVVHAYPTFNDVVKKAARLCYVDVLKNTWYIKILSSLFGAGK